VVVNQYRDKRDYANAIMASPPNLNRVFNVIFNELRLNKNKNVIEATGGFLFQHHVLQHSSLKGMWVEMPFELFYAQDWYQGMCNSFDNCREIFPNAITVSMWTGTWKEGDGNGKKRHWQNSNTSIVSNDDYTLPSDIANKIFVSGSIDRNFCWECIWNNGEQCYRRMDYYMHKYKCSHKEAIDRLMKESPSCDEKAI
jgi:hypothetical protein